MPGDPFALFGRDAEVATLMAYLDDLGGGTGRAVLIEGEPGIGKSSLARAAASAAAERDFRVYWARGDELGRALPLRPLLDALRASDAAGEPRMTTIKRLLRGEVGNVANPVVAASEQLLTLLAELCSVEPTVLVVDDLQWADLATISVWEWLGREVDHTALLLVATARPVPRRDELAAVRRMVGEDGIIRLTGLPAPAVASLVTTIADGTPGPELLRLATDAAGNPLYLTELMEALVRAGRLTVSASGQVEVTDGPVPDSLVAAITHRLDFLPGEVRDVLQAAALLGVVFRVSDLAMVLGTRITELVGVLDEARAAGVLRDADDMLAFRHPLLRTALYDAIPDAVRPVWHQDAARALAAAGVPVRPVARQLLAAVSAPGAGPLDESLLDWLADAAPTLVAQAPKATVELLRQAANRSPVTHRRGAALAGRLADALCRAGESAEAEAVATQAMAVVADPDLLVDLHWTVAQCRTMLGRSGETCEAVEKALAEPGLTAQQRARLLVIAARARWHTGELTVARDTAEEALATAKDADDRWAIGWSLHVLIIVSMMRGDVAAALPLFDRAVEVIGDNPTLTDLGLLLRINQAVTLGGLDRYDEAVRAAEKVRDRADLAGSLVRLAQAHSALGALLFSLGRWDDALAEVESLPDDFKDPSVVCWDRGVAAAIACHRGDTATAREHIERAAPSAEQIGSRLVPSLTLARALDRESAGDLAGALEILTTGDHTKELDEAEDLLPEAARVAAANDATDIAEGLAVEAATLAERSQVPHRLATAAYTRGLVDQDPDLLAKAAAHNATAGLPLSRARALEAEAVALAERGDRDAARKSFTGADDIYDELGASWDSARLRSRLRSYGIRRGPRAKHRAARSGWDSLTPTETKVAGMVAKGMSNRQIAEQLVLSPRTVGTHVSHILAKLGVRSRIDIARETAEHDRTSD